MGNALSIQKTKCLNLLTKNQVKTQYLACYYSVKLWEDSAKEGWGRNEEAALNIAP